jgi:hypothetical protein
MTLTQHNRPPAYLKIGDFIEAHGTKIRIDQIFVHNWDRQRRLFVKGRPISLNTASTDPVLGSGYHRLTLTPSDGFTIAGLPTTTSTSYQLPRMMAGSSWQMKAMRRSFCGRNEHYNGFERVGAAYGVNVGHGCSSR